MMDLSEALTSNQKSNFKKMRLSIRLHNLYNNYDILPPHTLARSAVSHPGAPFLWNAEGHA